MKLIEAYFEHKKEVKPNLYKNIGKVFISDTSAPNEPDEYLVTDKSGHLLQFDCLIEKNGTKKSFKGYMKYKLGIPKRQFSLGKGYKEGVFIVLDNKRYKIQENECSKGTILLYFENNQLVSMTAADMSDNQNQSAQREEREQLHPTLSLAVKDINEAGNIRNHPENFVDVRGANPATKPVLEEEYDKKAIFAENEAPLGRPPALEHNAEGDDSKLSLVSEETPSMRLMSYSKELGNECLRPLVHSPVEPSSNQERQKIDLQETERNESGIQNDKGLKLISGDISSLEYLKIVDSFLSTLNSTQHSQFVYFSFSNIKNLFGQVFCLYSNGIVTYHTVLSQRFMNFDQLFFRPNLVPRLCSVPLYTFTNLVVSYDWEPYYIASEYTLSYPFPESFIAKVLTCILKEERIIFFSYDSPLLKVIYLLNLIKPFSWPHIFCCPLNEEISEILHSPIPFIVCSKDKLKIPGVTTIDLETFTVSPHIPSSSFSEKLLTYIKTDVVAGCGAYFHVLDEEIHRMKIRKLQSSKSGMLEGINDPSTILDRQDSFLESFFGTRMFMMHMNTLPVKPCTYLVDIGDSEEIVMLPKAKLSQDLFINVVNLWIFLYSGDFRSVIEYCTRLGILTEVSSSLFVKLCYNNQYDLLHDLIQRLSDLSPDMVRNIIVVQELPQFTFKSMETVEIRHRLVCDDCGRIVPNLKHVDRLILSDCNNKASRDANQPDRQTKTRDGLIECVEGTEACLKAINEADDISGPGTNDINTRMKNMALESNIEPISVTKKDKFTQRDEHGGRQVIQRGSDRSEDSYDLPNSASASRVPSLNPKTPERLAGDCDCLKTYSEIVVIVQNQKLRFELVTPENILHIFNTCDTREIEAQQPAAYWSAVFYFKYFELPFIFAESEKELDLIIYDQTGTYLSESGPMLTLE